MSMVPLLCLIFAAAAQPVAGSLRAGSAEHSLEADRGQEAPQPGPRPPEAPTLRLCNAHPMGPAAVGLTRTTSHGSGYVSVGKVVPLRSARADLWFSDEIGMSAIQQPTTWLTAETGPVPTKSCRDLSLAAWEPGDYVNIEVGAIKTGVFLPQDIGGRDEYGRQVQGVEKESSRVVLLAVFNGNDRTDSVDVKIGNYRPVREPQVATMDLEPGCNMRTSSTKSRMQRLPPDLPNDVPLDYDVITGVFELGRYKIDILKNDGSADTTSVDATAELLAEKGGSYAVLRLGPGSVMVYPPAPARGAGGAGAGGAWGSRTGAAAGPRPLFAASLAAALAMAAAGPRV